MDDRAHPLRAGLADQGFDDGRRQLHERRLRGAAPGHVVEHQLDLGGAERFRPAHRAPSVLGRGRKAIQMAVGRLALIPPAALRGEDGRGREDAAGHPCERREAFAQSLRSRDVLGHQADRSHAPAEHRLQVLFGLGVDVRVDQARERSTSPSAAIDLRAGRKCRRAPPAWRAPPRRCDPPETTRRESASGGDPVPVDERRPADGDRGGEQNRSRHARRAEPTWTRARALSRAPLPRSRRDRCP